MSTREINFNPRQRAIVDGGGNLIIEEGANEMRVQRADVPSLIALIVGDADIAIHEAALSDANAKITELDEQLKETHANMIEAVRQREMFAADYARLERRFNDLRSEVAARDARDTVSTEAREAAATIDGQAIGAVDQLDQLGDIADADARDLRTRFGRTIQENAELINARLLAERQRDEARADADAWQAQCELVRIERRAYGEALAKIAPATRAAIDRELARPSSPVPDVREPDMTSGGAPVIFDPGPGVRCDFVPTHIVTIRPPRRDDPTITIPVRQVETEDGIFAGFGRGLRATYEAFDGSRDWGSTPVGVLFRRESVSRARGAFASTFGAAATVDIEPCDERGVVLK
jgi:hypothetical protein